MSFQRRLESSPHSLTGFQISLGMTMHAFLNQNNDVTMMDVIPAQAGIQSIHFHWIPNQVWNDNACFFKSKQ